MGNNNESIFESLRNNAMFWVGRPVETFNNLPKTIVILGPARSGTSIVAGALHHLGVFMGERSVKPVFEDTKLSSAFESKSWKNVKGILGEYNQKYPIWGYKRPNVLHDIQRLDEFLNLGYASADECDKYNQRFREFHSSLRNPVYILTFKDVFSISNRNRISMNTDLIRQMENALAYYSRLISIIKAIDFNALFVSSPKIVEEKEAFIEQLVHLCGISPTQEQLNAAISFITPNPKEYLIHTNIVRK